MNQIDRKAQLLLLCILVVLSSCTESDPGTPDFPQNLPIQNKMFKTLVTWTEIGGKKSNLINLANEATVYLTYVRSDSVFSRTVWNKDFSGTPDRFDSLDYDADWSVQKHELTIEYMFPLAVSPIDTTWYEVASNKVELHKRAGWLNKQKVFFCSEAFEDDQYFDQWED